MKQIYLILLISLTITKSFSQEDLFVCNNNIGHTSYDNNSAKHIKNSDELTPFINTNIKGHLSYYFEKKADSISFDHGQIIDLKKFYDKKDLTTTYTRKWIVAKYDFVFKLTDNQNGIKCYYFNLKMDEYGQLLLIEWPEPEPSDTYISLKSALERAKKYVLLNEIKYVSIKKELVHEKNIKSSFWVFIFEIDNKKNKKTEWKSNSYEKEVYEIKINIKSDNSTPIHGEYLTTKRMTVN